LFTDVAELHQALLEKDPKEFVSFFLFEPIPFAFSNNLSLWISWKSMLAKSIGVDPRDIVLTGSGAIGFSLNPKKEYKKFDHESDIDCGIVSQYHFEVAWRSLRQMRPQWLSLPHANRQAIVSHQKNYIFSGTIATDKILGLLPFGQDWQAALDAMGQVEPTKNREIKLRIYKDYDSLRAYQAAGLESLRGKLLESSESEIIDTEG
jgi:hypothetical protein